MKKLIIAATVLLLAAAGATAFASETPSTTSNQAVEEVVLTKDNVLRFNDVFYSDTVGNMNKQAKDMDAKLPSNEDIILVMDTPGGSIDAGIEGCNNLNSLNRPVKTLTLFAASMGFQTAQCVNGERLILDSGTLMSHKARGGFYGEFPGQLDSRYEYYLKRILKLDERAVERSNGKQTLESYRNLIENEKWCDGADCVNIGFADKVVKARCDQSLEGTFVKSEKFYFFGLSIDLRLTYANCPLITGVLDYEIYVDGEALFITKESKEKKDKEDLNNWYVTTSGRQLDKGIVDQLVLKVDGIVKAKNDKKNNIIRGY